MYPLDRRQLTVHIYSILHSIRKTSKFVKVSPTTVFRWIKNSARNPYPRRKGLFKSEQIVEFLKTSIANDPFISLASLKAQVVEFLHITVSKELLRTVIKKQGITKKTVRWYGCPDDLDVKTSEFLQRRDEYMRQGRIFFSIDEVSFGRHGKVVKGYSKKGELYLRKKPASIQTKSVVCCVSQDKIIHRNERQGSFNKLAFLQFLKETQIPKGAVILLDNVAFHRSKEVQEYVKSQGATILFTPPYSPWFNPIELCFSIVKRNYYKGFGIDDSFGIVTSNHLHSFFKKSLSTKGPLQRTKKN